MDRLGKSSVQNTDGMYRRLNNCALGFSPLNAQMQVCNKQPNAQRLVLVSRSGAGTAQAGDCREWWDGAGEWVLGDGSRVLEMRGFPRLALRVRSLHGSSTILCSRTLSG